MFPENSGATAMGDFTKAVVALGMVCLGGIAAQRITALGRSIRTHPFPYQQEASVVPAIRQEPGRRVIVSAKVKNNSCIVPGTVNGAPAMLAADTGDPNMADFSASYARRKLGIDTAKLHFLEWWPGTRYGKVAHATVREIRIGDVTWEDVDVEIYQNWHYAFGDESVGLLGLKALQARGIHLEMDGDICRLTVAPGLDEQAGSQCQSYALSKLSADQARQRCNAECSGAEWCKRLTKSNRP
jgi:hypothetical protein